MCIQVLKRTYVQYLRYGEGYRLTAKGTQLEIWGNIEWKDNVDFKFWLSGTKGSL